MCDSYVQGCINCVHSLIDHIVYKYPHFVNESVFFCCLLILFILLPYTRILHNIKYTLLRYVPKNLPLPFNSTERNGSFRSHLITLRPRSVPNPFNGTERNGSFRSHLITLRSRSVPNPFEVRAYFPFVLNSF